MLNEVRKKFNLNIFEILTNIINLKLSFFGEYLIECIFFNILLNIYRNQRTDNSA
jgi:hypothetical protein